jgi:hypothetical protein
MESLLKYHESDYFNDQDYYLMYNEGLKKYHLTQLQFCKGGWFSLLGLEYKMTSVPCMNSNELSGMKVTCEDSPIRGVVSSHHRIDENLGVHWEGGKNIRDYGMPTFWNEPKHLKLYNE